MLNGTKNPHQLLFQDVGNKKSAIPSPVLQLYYQNRSHNPFSPTLNPFFFLVLSIIPIIKDAALMMSTARIHCVARKGSKRSEETSTSAIKLNIHKSV